MVLGRRTSTVLYVTVLYFDCLICDCLKCEGLRRQVAKAMYGEQTDQIPRKKKEAYCSWCVFSVPKILHFEPFLDALS